MCSMWQMFSDGLIQSNIPVSPYVFQVIESACILPACASLTSCIGLSEAAVGPEAAVAMPHGVAELPLVALAWAGTAVL